MIFKHRGSCRVSHFVFLVVLVAIAVADSGRPLPRVGGLMHDEVEGKDGLR